MAKLIVSMASQMPLISLWGCFAFKTILLTNKAASHQRYKSIPTTVLCPNSLSSTYLAGRGVGQSRSPTHLQERKGGVVQFT